MKTKTFLSTFVLFVLLFGCDLPRPQPEAPKQKNTTAPSDEDVAIVEKIRQDLIADKNLVYAMRNINIRSKNGIVLLEGDVRTKEDRQLICYKVRNVDHVKGVENLLLVTTP